MGTSAELIHRRVDCVTGCTLAGAPTRVTKFAHRAFHPIRRIFRDKAGVRRLRAAECLRYTAHDAFKSRAKAERNRLARTYDVRAQAHYSWRQQFLQSALYH